MGPWRWEGLLLRSPLTYLPVFPLYYSISLPDTTSHLDLCRYEYPYEEEVSTTLHLERWIESRSYLLPLSTLPMTRQRKNNLHFTKRAVHRLEAVYSMYNHKYAKPPKNSNNFLTRWLPTPPPPPFFFPLPYSAITIKRVKKEGKGSDIQCNSKKGGGKGKGNLETTTPNPS